MCIFSQPPGGPSSHYCYTSARRTHLPDHLADMCAKAVQRPINPHCQKLLAASKRPAKVTAVTEDGKAKGKGKGKEKGKGKGKGKGNGDQAKGGKANKPKAKAKPKAVPKVRACDSKEKAKDAYQAAKKTFMSSFLDNDVLLMLGREIGILSLVALNLNPKKWHQQT